MTNCNDHCINNTIIKPGTIQQLNHDTNNIIYKEFENRDEKLNNKMLVSNLIGGGNEIISSNRNCIANEYNLLNNICISTATSSSSIVASAAQSAAAAAAAAADYNRIVSVYGSILPCSAHLPSAAAAAAAAASTLYPSTAVALNNGLMAASMFPSASYISSSPCMFTFFI